MPSRLAIAALALVAAPLMASTGSDSASLAAMAYMQGRLALSDNRIDVAARRFGEALKTSDDDMLARRALDVAILAGDRDSAFRIANGIVLADPAERQGGGSAAIADSLVALTQVTAAAHAREWRAYDAARLQFVEPARSGSQVPVIGTILEAYSLVAREAFDTAVARLDPADAGGASRSYLMEHRAHVLALARRWREAADAYGEIVANEGANIPRLRIAAAAAALEAGRTDPRYRDKAITLLGGGAAEDPQLVAARARLAANPRIEGRRLGALIGKPADGISLLLLRVAADLARSPSSGPALTFARLASFLTPEMPEAWLITADALARVGKTDLALAALDQAPRESLWQPQILARRAAILSSDERYDEARAILSAIARAPEGGIEDWARLGEIERRAGATDAAADSFARAIALVPKADAARYSQLWFLRGSALEVAGRWGEAEPDLRRAVELQANNPVYLNYLGYSLLDRRQKLEEARALIARAYAAAPENGAIIDSMGWAAFVAGDYAEAVRLLEMARAAEPADPTVADHLGDALWRVGRRIEARQAWAAATALEPTPKLAALLARKIDFGLDVALAGK